MKVAVIGEGFGARVMAPAYRHLGFDVEVVSSRDEAAVARACGSDVDLVSIHSPPFLHVQHVTWAIEGGRAVLCDKPFGLDAAEARTMRDRAVAAGGLHFLNLEFRHEPWRALMNALVRQGAIGELQHVSWTAIGERMRGKPHGWLFEAAQGGGWLRAYGSHMIDLMRLFFASEVADCGGTARIDVPLRCDRDSAERRVTAEDAYAVWLRMESGGTASLESACSAATALPDRLIFAGSEGSLDLTANAQLVLRRPGATDETIPAPPPGPQGLSPSVVGWLTIVRDALRENRQIAPSFDDGVATAEVVAKLRAAVG